MEKKTVHTNKKKKFIIIAIAVTLIVAVLFTFLGIFIYQRYTPEIRFAKAEQNWLKAAEKKAYDDLAIEVALGQEDNKISILIQLIGTRTYNKDNVHFEYDADIMYEGMKALSLKVIFKRDSVKNSLRITKSEGLMDFDTIETSLEQNALKDIELGVNSVSIYNTANIIVDDEGKFSINGDDSVSLLMNSASMIINQLTAIDLKAFLENRTNFSRVSGNLSYSKSFEINKMDNAQDISFFISWEDADEIFYSIENLPDRIKEIYQNRKIKIDNVPFLGSYTINFMNYMPDGIQANIRIINNTRYQIIK